MSEFLKKYDLNLIADKGFERFWEEICEYEINHNEFLCLEDLSQLYEVTLAEKSKEEKKAGGRYFTPLDVADLMSEFLIRYYLRENDKELRICDVGCGTGNLILSFLKNIGEERAIELLLNNKIYLYDNDKVALKVCQSIILSKYKEYREYIRLNLICDDFLNKKNNLVENSLVISNPPYARIKNIDSNWGKTAIVLESMDLYVAFIEKIINQSRYSIIISPFSFISGSNFKNLRKLLNNYTGKIFSFDNIPASIFNGKKKGIFNSNKTNSVRAAISIISKENNNGFQVSPLIRFKKAEREQLLNIEVLNNKFLPDTFQKIDNQNGVFYKCFKELEFIFDILKIKTNNFEYNLKSLLLKESNYKLYIPNTCRYYTVASLKKLNRKGQYELSFKDDSSLNFAFCLINSSFAYWHWRLYDGAIIYSLNLLLKLPIIYHLLTQKDIMFFNKMAKKMNNLMNNFVVKKNNIGEQENIKFPQYFRKIINKKILKILNIPTNNANLFNLLHSNLAFNR